MKDLFKLLMYTFTLFFAINSGNIIFVFIVCVISILYVIKSQKQTLDFKTCGEILKEDSEFNIMDTISHDLKVPALAQLRCLEQLTNGYYGELDISQKSVVRELEQSCKSVINIIEMLTCSYNLDAKIIKLCYEKCNLKELISLSVEKIEELAEEKNIIFEYLGIKNDIYVLADKKELERAILNLLICVINYSLCGNIVKITVNEEQNNRLSFNISGNFLENFEKAKYSTIGQNISLQFCKKIIELHKGRIYYWKDNDLKQNISFVIPQKPSNANVF